ncbi:DMT family transporter [Alisedimentitalea sp. MJ-SS2]|uniref:DMT family transporter n=1 Tax=Aliisedimentitalea sp. MJ-SS2 TaxID=3049795 RepID=UPI00290AF17F|nr:DMT family transporter [Alisedimentitalea sp. MJ-SS2]MDU8925793.1 DMT family transporter [Alisedimentitalea sp. MJ-SS2]
MANNNLRGIALLITAMAFFAATDACVQLATQTLPKGQVLSLMGGGGALIFAALTRSKGHRLIAADLVSWPMLLRNSAEIVATFSFVTALSTVGISLASSVIQATPLAVTFFAIILLKEQVGWRRWGAILIGFAGVLIILRPGLSGFEPNALWAVAAMLGLALRDVSTRLMPGTTPSTRIAFYGMAVLTLGGWVHMLLIEPPQPLTVASSSYVLGTVVLGSLGYFAMIQAMRTGEISVVAPFRYIRIIFALIVGAIVFGERPDLLTYLGCGITIAAGIYAFWREARLSKKGNAS